MARRRRSSASAGHRLRAEDLEVRCRDKQKPVQRNAANARERARMRVLSKAFTRLKTSLPWVPEDTKLSKLDTLRLAAGYISHLKQVLNDDGASSSSGSEDGQTGTSPTCLHPLTLVRGLFFHRHLVSQEFEA
ncbi:unnamed protein product [Ixodes pacificus]